MNIVNEQEIETIFEVLKGNDPNYVHTVDFNNAAY